MADIQSAQDFSNAIRTKAQSTGPDTIAVDPLFEEDPNAAAVIEFAIKRRKNILIVGPTGCGKSSLFINVCARLKERLEIVSMDGEVSTDNLLAKMILTVQDGKEVTEVAYGPALRAYKDGKGLLLEEVDMGNADVLASMHRILETQSGFYTCNVGAQDSIKKASTFFCAATANTTGWGEDTFIYAGTKPLNQAFMNRFSLTVKLDYLPPKKESAVVVRKTGISKQVADQMVEVAAEVRDARTKAVDRVASVISTRDLLEWADVVQGMKLAPSIAAEYAFLSRAPESDAEIMRRFISNHLS